MSSKLNKSKSSPGAKATKQDQGTLKVTRRSTRAASKSNMKQVHEEDPADDETESIQMDGNDMSENVEAIEEVLLEEEDEEDLEQEETGEEIEGGCYYVDVKGNYYFKASHDAEPVLTTIDGDPFTAEVNQNMKIEQDSETYFLVMDEDGNKSTIVRDGELGAGDDEIYDFDDSEFEIQDSPPSTATKSGSTQRNRNSSDRTLMCTYCNYTTNKMFLLSRHLKTHCEDRPHKCSVCERGFKTMASLQNHVNTHTGTKPHRCKSCDNCFTTSGELTRHVRYKHTHERPHKCSECDYSSVELSKLKRHIRTHTGEKPFQCPHCTYASPDKFKLTRHLRIHTGEKPYCCDICFARFTQSNSLKAHKLIHQVGDKPVYQCELCPTTCGRKTDLRIHVQKLHTAEKPIKCKRCDNVFEDRYSYKIHVKTHEGERCFKCEFCPYASISARHLESHLLLHTNQKPFKCSECSQCFRQKQLLKRHINFYHNPDYVVPTPKAKTHLCPSCPRTFRHRGNLFRHMALHDPDSQLHEEQAALREGRQKMVQITLEEPTDDERPSMTGMTGDVVTVQNEDGEYVVLEVIQLQDKDETVTNTSSEPRRNQPNTWKRTAKNAEGAKAKDTSAPSTSTTGAKKRGKASKSQQLVVKQESPEEENSLDNESDFHGTKDEKLVPEEDQEIMINQVDESGDNELIFTNEDLEDTELLMSTLTDTKPSRYDLSTINVSQAEIEKNMSNCFGFSDDDDDDLDQEATITMLQ